MVRLALAAVLMMAFAPSLSRWLAEEPGSGLVELCTAVGLKVVPATDIGSHADAGSLPDHAGRDADCAYCPLLATTALLPLSLVLPAVPAPRQPWSRPRTIVRAVAPVFPGCESRGPPSVA